MINFAVLKSEEMARKVTIFSILFLTLFCNAQHLMAQFVGQDTTRRVITPAVGFLTITPDARVAAMGDAGAAISPDANAAFWNAGKLAFAEANYGFSLNYTPWLNKIVDDMSISYLSGYYKLTEDQAIGLNLRYFDLGDIDLFDIFGGSTGSVRPREWSIGGTYSRKLSEELGIGISLRFIHSNLTQNIASLGNDNKPGTSLAGDIGVYYSKDIEVGATTSNLSFAGSISNIGGKISYLNDETKDFLPTNLRLGTAFKTNFDAYNTITFALDFNKLMVPTPPIFETDENGEIVFDPNGNPVILDGKDPNRGVISGMFGSFADAPGGFSEELQEVMISIGAEYWYNEIFAARAGYFYEHQDKGDRKYFTVGLGFRYQVFGFDFAYLVPTEQEHPLAETLRFSLLFNFDESN
jgi:hypothetical protein